MAFGQPNKKAILVIKPVHTFYLFFTILYSCANKDTAILSAFDVYCEMVANDAKPLALHYPMEKESVDGLWGQFLDIAKKHDVQLYEENNFPASMLFPPALTSGKTVVLIYRGNRLNQYQQLKADLETVDEADKEALEALARRFGRLLGYSPQGINRLISQNSTFRTLASFGVSGQVTHLYYDNLEDAVSFYENVLGLTKTDDTQFQIGDDTFIAIHPINENHPKGQSKSTAIAFLTDQLPEWYAHLQEKNIAIKYTYKPKIGGPHDGFVAIDPGGYLLEFEQFKQHPENELLVAILSENKRVATSVSNFNFYGSITWTYHKDLLKMQQFYDETLGYQLVADQGWTKIYKTSKTGFIGLVDERRGMEDYAETKAVEIEWTISDWASFNDYSGEFGMLKSNAQLGPEKYIYHVKEAMKKVQ